MQPNTIAAIILISVITILAITAFFLTKALIKSSKTTNKEKEEGKPLLSFDEFMKEYLSRKMTERTGYPSRIERIRKIKPKNISIKEMFSKENQLLAYGVIKHESMSENLEFIAMLDPEKVKEQENMLSQAIDSFCYFTEDNFKNLTKQHAESILSKYVASDYEIVIKGWEDAMEQAEKEEEYELMNKLSLLKKERGDSI